MHTTTGYGHACVEVDDGRTAPIGTINRITVVGITVDPSVAVDCMYTGGTAVR